jgi:hypothetical protein
MGSQISVQSSENIQEQVSNTVNKVVNNVNNSLSSSSSTTQTLKFKVAGNFHNEGKFHIEQTSQVQMNAFVENFAKTVSKVTSDIQSSLDIDNIIDSTMKQSGIILGQSQVNSQSSKITQSFEDNLSSIVESAINSKINMDVKNKNTIEVIVDGNFMNTQGADYKLTQSSVIKLISNAISKSMVDSILDSSIVNSAKASTRMSTTMTQEGISEWAVLLLLLIPIFVVGGAGFFFILLLKLLLPLMLIIIGIISIVQYRNAVYYTCVNDPDSDNYINTDLKEGGDPVKEGLYINPDFRDIKKTKDFPEGYGDPETAYLIPEKQKEYDILLKQLEDKKENKDDINKKMSSISENESNWMCVNGSDPINDHSKSDHKVLFFIPAKNWSIWYGIGLIIVGVLISIILILTNESSKTTTNMSEPIPYNTQNIQRGGKTLFKIVERYLKKL